MIMDAFSKQVVLVTGASGNLGKAVAEQFFAAGAQVAAVDRAADGLTKLFPAWVNAPDVILVGGIDGTDESSVAQMVQAVMERFGRIDILVNTVGGYRAGTPVHETSLETWDFMMNLNARSAFTVSRAVLPVMLRQEHGKIIHIAASSAQKGSANSAAYAASKSAVARLTESMADEYKRQGINVNAILPGTIDTPQNRQAMPGADYSLWVTPVELARVILFLASSDADPIHGALIPVYGTK
jgi:NAD(P)-dependent dehydrogenase (short-subunit alcohol dehydrogenase family)